MDACLRERFGFFLEHAGWCCGRRAEGALALARAEALLMRAVELDVASVEWVDDDVVDLSWDEDGSVARGLDSGALVGPCGCVVRVGAVLTYPVSSGVESQRESSVSVWGVIVNAPTHRCDDPYMRVVVAGLASELADDLRQAVGDAVSALRLSCVECGDPAEARLGVCAACVKDARDGVTDDRSRDELAAAVRMLVAGAVA